MVPAGKIGGSPAPEGQEFTLTVQLQGRLTTVQEFENIVLRSTADGGLVRFKDVGRVELGGETYGIDAMDINRTLLLLVLPSINSREVMRLKCPME